MAENKVYKWLEQNPEYVGIVCRNEADAERCIEILQPFLKGNLDRPDFRGYARCGYAYVRIGFRIVNGLYTFGIGDSEALMREYNAVPIEFEDFLRETSEDSEIFLSAFLY